MAVMALAPEARIRYAPSAVTEEPAASVAEEPGDNGESA